MLEQFSRWLRRYQGIEANPIYRLAVNVATGKMSYERALDRAASHEVNARLADGDLLELDQQVEAEARSNVDFALILARLNAETARAKGFERVLVDLYLRIAELLDREGDEAEREYYFREALHTAQRISYITGQRRALNRLARIAFERGDTEDARDLLLQQLDAGREESDTRAEIETAILLADIALSDGDVASAHDLYHRAARSARRIGFFSGAVDALLRQVSILRERGDLQGALMLLRQAGDAAERTVDTALQADVAFRTGALMRELNMAEEAIEHLTVAGEKARLLGDLSIESRSLKMLSELEHRLSHSEDALQHYERLVSLESSVGNRLEAGRAMVAIGEIHLAHDRPSAAIGVLTEARDIAQLAGDNDMSVHVNSLLGRALATIGREREALQSLEYALRGSRSRGDHDAEAELLITAGEIMLRTGDPNDAAPLIGRAEDLARATSDNALRAGLYGLIGQAALVERRLQDAEDAFVSAAAAARAAGRPGESLRYLPLLARLAGETGDLDRAVRYLDSAIEEAVQLGDEARVCAFHGQAARLYAGIGRFKEAEDRYERALDVAEQLGDARLEARALQGMAAIYDTTGKLEEAIELYYRALDAANRVGDTRTIATTHYNLGALLVDEERDDEARTHLLRARDAAEAINDYGLADRARTLLGVLAPPSFSFHGLETQSTDLPLGEEPVRPRDQQIH